MNSEHAYQILAANLYDSGAQCWTRAQELDSYYRYLLRLTYCLGALLLVRATPMNMEPIITHVYKNNSEQTQDISVRYPEVE